MSRRAVRSSPHPPLERANGSSIERTQMLGAALVGATVLPRGGMRSVIINLAYETSVVVLVMGELTQTVNLCRTWPDVGQLGRIQMAGGSNDYPRSRALA